MQNWSLLPKFLNIHQILYICLISYNVLVLSTISIHPLFDDIGNTSYVFISIKSLHKDEADKKGPEVLHKGIPKRHFSRSFTIADDVEIKGAELKDGLLKVSLEKIVPDSKKPRTIKIK